MLVYAATEAEILAPSRVQESARRIREVGFDSVYLEFRNVKASRTGQRFQFAMRQMIQCFKKQGLYVALEASFNNLDAVLLEEAPEAFTDSLHWRVCIAQSGTVSLTLGGDVSTWSFPYAAVVDRFGSQVEIKQRMDLSGPSIFIEGGGCAMTRHPGRSQASFVWSLPSVADGSEVLIVTRKHHDYSFKDLGHPELLKRLPALLELRGHLGVDELFLDEPHFGFAFYDNDGRAISERLLSEFDKRFGYRLENVLPALWLDVAGAESTRVRLHYAELLESSLEAMEKVIVSTREKLTAEGIVLTLGGHRTMHEELSDDVLIGCSDYFRHDFATTASYTDSVYERPDSMAAMGQLARSMAARSQGRLAWNMSWGFHPTPQRQKFYAQLLGAMNVRWCLHAWNDTMMFGPGYPHHPCWSTISADLAVHRSFIDELEGWTPEVNTLLLYNWRAPAVATGAIRHVHRRSLILLAWTLTRQSVPFLFVDSDELKDRLNALPEIRRVILHWPQALPLAVWEALSPWVEKGGELIILGPWPTISSDGVAFTDQGFSLSKFCGAEAQSEEINLALGDSISWQETDYCIDPKSISPQIDDAPPTTWLDRWPVQPLKATNATPVCWKDLAVIATEFRQQNGKVVTATFEPSFAPGLIEHLLGLQNKPVLNVRLTYRRGDERKTISIPWQDHP